MTSTNEKEEKERLERILKQLEEGEITLDSPCANMYEPWTKEEEEKFDKVLAEMFGFKNE